MSTKLLSLLVGVLLVVCFVLIVMLVNTSRVEGWATYCGQQYCPPPRPPPTTPAGGIGIPFGKIGGGGGWGGGGWGH